MNETSPIDVQAGRAADPVCFVHSGLPVYPVTAPYDPPALFPEFANFVRPCGDNHLFTAVRELFRSAKLDAANCNTRWWNPLGQWIQPGMNVVVKPNWVKHHSPSEAATCTHPSLIRVMVDYVLLALRGQGRVSVLDAPLQSCRFSEYEERSQLRVLREHYQSVAETVEFLDIRKVQADIDDETSFIKRVYEVAGDPRGYSTINLGPASRLAPITRAGTRFGVTDYNAGPTNVHHSLSRHAYLISNTVLESDVIISLPKLKTHMKTGMTGALKNFIGINGCKDYLPHFRKGSTQSGGDEYPRPTVLNSLAGNVRRTLQGRAPACVWRFARRLGMAAIAGGEASGDARIIQGGAWYGNDTLWRTVYDLVRIARFADKDAGERAVARPILTLMDAVIAGEGNGPLKPIPRPAGLLMWGEDPGAIDLIASRLMGFDWRKIPLLNHLADTESRTIRSFDDSLAIDELVHFCGAMCVPFSFRPPMGWSGHIELQD